MSKNLEIVEFDESDNTESAVPISPVVIVPAQETPKVVATQNAEHAQENKVCQIYAYY
jgi:hypothetical protein